MLELYANIKKFRKMKGMSQEQLAKLTGYTDRSSIAKIEKGEIDIPQSKILMFANALGVDASTLMGDTGIVGQPTIEIDDKLASFIDAYKAASPSLRNAALAVLESGVQSHDASHSPQDTTQ